jgi:hypothetical protein
METRESLELDVPVLIEAEKAEQLPNPVKKEKNASKPTLSEPCPFS